MLRTPGCLSCYQLGINILAFLTWEQIASVLAEIKGEKSNYYDVPSFSVSLSENVLDRGQTGLYIPGEQA